MTEQLLIWILAVPFLSAIFGGLLGGRYPLFTKYLSVASSVVVAFLGIHLAQAATGAQHVSLTWLQLGQLSISAGILYTPLAAAMVLVVGWVGLAVHLFSLRYMRDDAAQPRYWAGLSLFTCAMLGLTLADNLAMLFAFWEMVGFGSYLLIGHYSTPVAGRAANKAFLVNRLADVFFMAGIGCMLLHTGTLSLAEIPARFVELAPQVQVMIASFLLCGVVAKSAQLPLHIWLPDAMAGPTPVSALIHAATMVAAGVYLLCRLPVVFEPLQPVIACLGALTAVCAAIWAFGQTDLKRVLAYSTLSQLGFMVAGFGLGSPAAAFFHLTTHAFFKALLFLVAGAIIDACHHQQDAQRMGGLWRRMPFTFAMFVIGALALAGFPYTAGFFSKDSIFAIAQENYLPVFYALLIASLLTALYMGRLAGMVFFGRPRSDEAAHAHEGGLQYHAPLVLLAFGAIAGGSLAFYPGFVARVFAHVPHPHQPQFFMVWGIFAGLAMCVAAWIYSQGKTDPLRKLLGPFYYSVQTGFSFDQLWNNIGYTLTGVVTRAFHFIDEVLVGGGFINSVGATCGMAGFLALQTYRKLLTYTLYWILLGVGLLVLFAYL